MTSAVAQKSQEIGKIKDKEIPTRISEKRAPSDQNSTQEPTSTVEIDNKSIQSKEETVAIKVPVKLSKKKKTPSGQNSTDSTSLSTLGANKISHKLFGNKKKPEETDQVKL
jgi:hypothetical protein